MNQLSSTEVVLLGTLSEAPRHGYEINKILEERNVRKWADIAFSSIYYVLDKLQTKGLVTSAEAEGKEKKQYSITNKGIAALKEEANNLIRYRRPANTPIMTGIAVSNLIGDENLIESLRCRKAELELDFEALRSKQSEIQDAPQSALRLFSLSKTLLEAELKWINKEIERIKQL